VSPTRDVPTGTRHTERMTTTPRPGVPLPSRAVLVCGGTGAIGRSLVHALVDEGYRVAFSGRSRDRGEALAAASGSEFIQHTDDLDGTTVVRCATELLGDLHGIVLNAGAIEHAPLGDTSIDRLREVLYVNVTVPVRQAQAAADAMPRGASIVAVSSNAGLWPETEIGAYSVSKAALLAACRTLAVEYGVRGIRVNAVCPGDTAPGMAASIAGGHGFVTLPPLARLGQPSDTAAAVSFLLSPAAEFITGAHLLVDGGMHAALDAGRPQ
jgi:NAD(P)-dependent dehydrogenase (short-subunit alcohol dehydrogenase family)